MINEVMLYVICMYAIIGMPIVLSIGYKRKKIEEYYSIYFCIFVVVLLVWLGIIINIEFWNDML